MERHLAGTRRDHGEYQRDQFVEAFDLGETAKTISIRPIITGEDYSNNSLEVDNNPTGPPHKPPASDHATLWLDDASPPSTRCTSIRATSNGLMPPSRRTTSGSTYSSSPPSGDSKSASSGSPGTISAAQYRPSSTHLNHSGNRSSFDLVCSRST